MATVEPIRIKGMREFQSALRKLDGHKALRVAMNNAVEVVASDIRRKVPYRDGDAYRSVRASSTQTSARITAGGKKAPYFPWLDYGGTVGRGRTGRGGVESARGRADFGTAGAVKRPWKPEGRYVYPSFARHREDMLEILSVELARAANAAGLDVT